MIHVRVRHEHMGDAQELAARQRAQIAEVEQECTAAEPEVDEQAWIGKGLVHQPRLDQPAHELANNCSRMVLRCVSCSAWESNSVCSRPSAFLISWPSRFSSAMMAFCLAIRLLPSAI